MLTFSYDGYKVHIDDAGHAEYAKIHPIHPLEYPCVTNDPPVSIVMLAGQILQLVATDTIRAEMRYARLREELMIATNDVESAERAKCAAKRARVSAGVAQLNLSAQLKEAEESLQSAKAKGALKAEESGYRDARQRRRNRQEW